jgi:lipopolysaccharide export system protein LptA
MQRRNKINVFLFLCAFLCAPFSLWAQQPGKGLDSANMKLIQITKTKQIIKNEADVFQRFVDSVQIEHDGVVMTCDSAFLYIEENKVEAFSRVTMTKAGGSTVTADYMRYDGRSGKAYLKGNVMIDDQGNQLYTEDLEYDIRTKVGQYLREGTLINSETSVTSNEGKYDGFSKQTWFKGNVVVSNPKYTIESKQLGYHLETKVVEILDSSLVTTEETLIYSARGSYNTQSTQASFTARTTVDMGDQVLVADKLEYNEKNLAGKAWGNVSIQDIENNSVMFCNQADYDKRSGWGKAVGDVQIDQDGGRSILWCKEVQFNKLTGYVKAKGEVEWMDTVEKTALLADVVEYNDFTKFTLATGHPKLKAIADADTTFLRADTMMSIRVSDINNLKWKSLWENKKIIGKQYNLLVADSSFIKKDIDYDPKLIIAQHRVKIFSDSMQAVCDSLSYSQVDSCFRLYIQPVLWSQDRQATGDSIRIRMVQNRPKQISLLGHAFLFSASGFTNLYDQVSGVTIDAWLDSNRVREAFVNKNAQCLYHIHGDDGGYVGTNQAESAEMRLYFNQRTIRRIAFINDPKGKVLPLDKINESNRVLDGFKQYPERRPPNREAILND